MKHTAGAILLKNKKILLIKRSNYTIMYPGYWSLPGGRGEEDDLPETTVIREVKEEVGLDFIPEILFHSSLIAHSGETRKTHRYLGSFSGGITIQEDEIDGYAWYTYDEARVLSLAFDYMELIELLHDKKLI